MGPADAGSQDEAVVVADELQDAGDLDLEQRRHAADGLLHQLVRARPFERVLTESRDSCLLGGAAGQLGLGLLLLADVGEDPVPPLRPVAVLDQHGIVADPHEVALAVQHPVLDRAVVRRPADVVALHLDHALPIVGVQPLSPQARVGEPFVGGIAEDRPDLGAHVVPHAVIARVRDVHDRGNLLEQLGIVGGDLAWPLRSRKRGWIDVGAVYMARHFRVFIGICEQCREFRRRILTGL